MTTICLVVLAGSHDEVQLTPAVTKAVDELVVVVNPKAQFGGMGTIANRVLTRTKCDVFGMIHADTTWWTGDVARLAEVTAEGHIAGIVGCALEPQPYGDSYIVWGHKLPAGKAVEVSTLDACSIFMRPDAGVTFDEVTFPSFHCCVEDVCLTGLANGIKTMVPDVKAVHIGTRHENPGAWVAEFHDYRRKLVEKHKGVFFRTTTG